MLLLYRRRAELRGNRSQFTFHYASTLSGSGSPACHSWALFTFHYASTLSSGTCRGNGSRAIYIPLCFYFIVACMMWYCCSVYIYIPLCFYFIWMSLCWPPMQTWFTFHYASTLSNILMSAKNLAWIIYIPLCFYFITSVLRRKELSAWFTFHYASTLSRITASQQIRRVLFTFHYASTLSASARHFREQFLHLHSTMLLLYLCKEWFRTENNPIYIPLCFYFIAMTINSCMPLSCIYIPLCFYFIEVLLVLVSIAACIYIPLCFYFIPLIRRLFRPALQFTFHYASTLSDSPCPQM